VPSDLATEPGISYFSEYCIMNWETGLGCDSASDSGHSFIIWAMREKDLIKRQ
jgi:hypothetical protein